MREQSKIYLIICGVLELRRNAKKSSSWK